MIKLTRMTKRKYRAHVADRMLLEPISEWCEKQFGSKGTLKNQRWRLGVPIKQSSPGYPHKKYHELWNDPVGFYVYFKFHEDAIIFILKWTN